MSILQSIGMHCLEQGELLLRIILASILGMAIGFERKNRSKMAGVRTHAIVAFGAALMMVVSKYGFGDMVEFDASRVAAQIVSGVGGGNLGHGWRRHEHRLRAVFCGNCQRIAAGRPAGAAAPGRFSVQ